MGRNVGSDSRNIDSRDIEDSGEAQDFSVGGEASQSVRVQRSNQCGNWRGSTEDCQRARSLLEESWEEIDDGGGISRINAVDNGGGISETLSGVETVKNLLKNSLVSLS